MKLSSSLLARFALALLLAAAFLALPAYAPAATEYFWYGGTSGTYPSGGLTWDTSNTNWSTVTPPNPQTLPPANTWDITNGPNGIARFNIDNDVASIGSSVTVYPSSIRFSGDGAVVNGPGVIGFATTTSLFT